MGQDPDAIRQDIEKTRERMGDTVDALGHKADVPSRARERVSGAVDTVRSKVGGATPDGQEVRQGAQRAVGVVQSNPLGLAIGAAAVGFLAGLAIPSSRVEDERLGPISDKMTEQAVETGREAVQRGQEVVTQAAEAAKETAREQASEHGQQLAESARESAQQVRSEM